MKTHLSIHFISLKPYKLHAHNFIHLWTFSRNKKIDIEPTPSALLGRTVVLLSRLSAPHLYSLGLLWKCCHWVEPTLPSSWGQPMFCLPFQDPTTILPLGSTSFLSHRLPSVPSSLFRRITLTVPPDMATSFLFIVCIQQDPMLLLLSDRDPVFSFLGCPKPCLPSHSPKQTTPQAFQSSSQVSLTTPQ